MPFASNVKRSYHISYMCLVLDDDNGDLLGSTVEPCELVPSFL